MKIVYLNVCENFKKMKSIYFLLISILCIGCVKEKSFADDIVLSFPKNTEMKTQEFNEDGNEFGENLFYIGKIAKNIEVKYYKNFIAPIPINPSDAINEKLFPYFRNQNLVQGETYYKDMIQDLNSNNLEIHARIKDTIPLYKRDFNEKGIKKHYAFPVFIKNISNQILKIPIESKNAALYIYDKELKRFFFVRNSNYMIEGFGNQKQPYFELKPNEILVYAYPYFKKGKKQKAKMKFYNASSKEFEISIDENIIKNQRDNDYE